MIGKDELQKYFVPIVGTAISLILVRWFVKRKTSLQFELTKSINASPKTVFDFLVNPETYYTINRKGYSPTQIKKNGENSLTYLLEDKIAGFEIKTHVNQTTKTEPNYEVRKDWKNLGTPMTITWNIMKEEGDENKTNLVFKSEAEGDWYMIQLLKLSKKEMSRKLDVLAKKVEKSD
ncbi:hypothetical protein ABK040_010910 [Willaertia magna]